jgi:hypothetical protein
MASRWRYCQRRSSHDLVRTPPVSVIDWAKPGKIRQVSSVEAAAEELLKWPKTKKRDRAATLMADAMEGTADIARKTAFEAAAKEAEVWVQYRGP